MNDAKWKDTERILRLLDETAKARRRAEDPWLGWRRAWKILKWTAAAVITTLLVSASGLTSCD